MLMSSRFDNKYYDTNDFNCYSDMKPEMQPSQNQAQSYLNKNHK